MNESTIRRAVGFAGLSTAVLILVEVPLYFVYSGPPPDGNVLTRTLFGLVGMTSLIVFVTGLHSVVTSPRMEPVGALMTAAGLMWVTVEFVSKGLETGAVIAAPEPIDPTIAVTGTYLLYGSITRLIEALFLVAFGYAVSRSRALPRWTTRSAYLLAAVNLAFVPSLYFGNDPANFYAANGWGTTASMGAVFMLWLLAVSVSIIRSAAAHASHAGITQQLSTTG